MHLPIYDARRIHGIIDADDYRACQRSMIARANLERVRAPGWDYTLPLAEIRVSDVTLTAYINHGRWCADCPACRAGMGVLVSARLALCLSCGAEYHDVMLPEDRTTIEAALAVAHERALQNWEPPKEASHAS